MIERTENPEKVEQKPDVKVEEKVNKLPLAPIKRLLKEQGVQSISKSGLEEVRFIVSDIIRDMGRNILIFTRHRKAKISSKEDVLLAIR